MTKSDLKSEQQPVWMQILAELEKDIEKGIFPVGSLLPTESRLAQRFGVNRHTVRRALAELASNDLVHSQKGLGTRVTRKPLSYPIGRITRFRQNLGHMSIHAGRILVRAETLPAQPKQLDVLKLTDGSSVHVLEFVSLADQQRICFTRAFYPAEHLDSFVGNFEASLSVSKALATNGVTTFERQQTQICAVMPKPLIRRHLEISANQACLRTDAISVASAGPLNGQPIEMARSWFVGSRVELFVDHT